MKTSVSELNLTILVNKNNFKTTCKFVRRIDPSIEKHLAPGEVISSANLLFRFQRQDKRMPKMENGIKD